ncbi:MAG: hypothetical protein WAU77_14450 [Solirubrobacteraceae bacterium]
MRVNPIALDAKQRREFGGIYELRRWPRLRSCDQVGYLPCDLLDVGGVEPHRRDRRPARSPGGLSLVMYRGDSTA